MKKKHLTVITILICVINSTYSQSPTISNGNFESYTSTPGCSPMIYVLGNNWDGITILQDEATCNQISAWRGPTSQLIYYNSSSTSSCQPISPHGGNGYVVGHTLGFYGNCENVSRFDVIVQPISGTLISGNNYIVTCYVKQISISLDWLHAFLVTQSVGSSTSVAGATAIANDVTTQLFQINGYNAYTSNLTSVGNGWYKYEKIFTITSTDSYQLVIGNMYECNHTSSCVSPSEWAIDDVNFELEPCATYAGTYYQLPNACCQATGYEPVILNPIYYNGCTNSVSWTPCATDQYFTSYFTGGTNPSWNTPSVDPLSVTNSTNSNGCINFNVTTSGPCCETTSQCIQVCQGTLEPCCKMPNPNSNPTNITSIPKTGTDTREFGVYPNPASSILSVDLPSIAEYIRIYNIEGRKVYEINEVTESSISIDILKFKKGVYFLSTIINSDLRSVKIVIE